MTAKKPSHSFKVGDRVKIRHWPDLRARIVEERGALGPGGMLVYRIRIAGDWKQPYVEVREDQLIPVPPKPKAKIGAAAEKSRKGGPRSRTTAGNPATVTIEEAQARLPELIDQLLRGGPLTIICGNQPVAQLVPLPIEKPRPVAGRGRGKIVIAAEDAEHLKDFEEYMP